MESVIERIIELDNDNEAYLEMLSQPILQDINYYENKMKKLQLFVRRIFEQPVGQAFRRPRYLQPKFDEDYILRRMDGRNVLHEVPSIDLYTEIIKRAKNRIFRRK